MRKGIANNKYLLWFANEHVDFRLPEIKSVIKLLNLDIKIDTNDVNNPFWVVELKTEDDARRLASRSFSLRAVLQLWGYADTLSGLHECVRSYPTHLQDRILAENQSFKVDVTTFNRSFSLKEKIDRIEMFDYLNPKASVDLKSPSNILHFIEYYGLDPNLAPETPYFYYFGHWVCDGQRSKIHEYSLKNRKFIGNTSMDAQLSFIMANMACIKPGDFVFDPFVGSGSLLVAAASFGAFVFGTDIDYLMLHGKTKPTRKQARDRPRDKESIMANLLQYNLSDKYVDVVVADSSLPLLRPGILFDAIITDPPYGVREANERIGSYKECESLKKEHQASHIPSKVEYSLGSLFGDLLNLAAKHLRIGGRLVSWIPVRRGFSVDLPSHPAFSLIASSEQFLSALTARRLITWEKTNDLSGATSTVPKTLSTNFRQVHFNREETRKAKRMGLLANAEIYKCFK